MLKVPWRHKSPNSVLKLLSKTNNDVTDHAIYLDLIKNSDNYDVIMTQNLVEPPYDVINLKNPVKLRHENNFTRITSSKKLSSSARKEFKFDYTSQNCFDSICRHVEVNLRDPIIRWQRMKMKWYLSFFSFWINFNEFELLRNTVYESEKNLTGRREAWENEQLEA